MINIIPIPQIPFPYWGTLPAGLQFNMTSQKLSSTEETTLTNTTFFKWLAMWCACKGPTPLLPGGVYLKGHPGSLRDHLVPLLGLIQCLALVMAYLSLPTNGSLGALSEKLCHTDAHLRNLSLRNLAHAGTDFPSSLWSFNKRISKGKVHDRHH